MSEIDYIWGTSSVQGRSGWLVQSCTKTKGAEEAQARNNVGEPQKIHFYAKTEEISLDVYIPSDESSFPSIGDTFGYNGTNYYVSGVTITESNTDFVRYSISGKRFTTAGLPANS